MKKYIYLLFGAATLLGGCAQDNFLDLSSDSIEGNSDSEGINAPDFSTTDNKIPGVLHVKVRKNMLEEIKRVNPTGVTLHSAPSALSATLSSITATSLKPLFNMDPRFEKRFRASELDCWYEVRFAETQDLQQTLQTLSLSNQFSIVEPVYATSVPTMMAPATRTPASFPPAEDMPFNDPLMNRQWHYQNFGTTPESVKGADANVFEAWKMETGKPNVIVAVVDGGIDVTHEDLKESLWVNPGEIPGNEVDDDGNGYVDDIYGWNYCSQSGNITLDGVGHGTHVAGTVAARNNNGIGVAGVAGGDGSPESGVRVMSCQKFEGPYDGNNSDDYSVTGEDAYRYSADNGAVISQNSWGYNAPNVMPASMKAAFDYFIKYAGCDDDGNQLPDSPMKGGVIIVAAGNNDADALYYPGAYEPTIAVSAMAPNWEKTWYTNRGDWVDIMAPGGDHYFTDGYVVSTLPGNTYGEMAGTSQACPHVSGIAALIVSHFGGPGFTNDDLKARLLGSLRPENIDVHNPDYIGRLGVGYIDAAQAFAVNQQKHPDVVADLSAAPDYISMMLTWSAVRDEDDSTPIKYLVYQSEQEITESNRGELSPLSVSAVGFEPGDQMSCALTGLKDNTVYYVGIVAVDRWGLESDLSSLKVTTKQNGRPVVEGIPEEVLRVSDAKVQKFDVRISDPEGHKMTYLVKGETRGVSAAREGDVLHFTIRAVAPISDVPYQVELHVTDEMNGTTVVNIPFVVYKYEAPSIIQNFSDLMLDASHTTQTFDLNQYFKGSDLTFSATSSDESVVTAVVEGSTLTLTGKKQGQATVDITAANGEDWLKSSFSVLYAQNKDEVVYQVYPLPATTQLNILLNPMITQAEVSIRTLFGEEVFSNRYSVSKSQPISIGLQQLAAGTYTLLVKTSKGTYKKTFVKQ